MFADRQVDSTTGAIVLTGIFPNPGNILRPGQYAKVRATTGVRSGAMLIPQAAVTELQGGYEVTVIDQNNRAAIRNVKPGDRLGTMWLIKDGLNPGERVVTAGQQALRPGTTVQVK
jgi:membrane fusion protein (multidrug efflux system)